MERLIKFKYTFKRKSDGYIWQLIVDLEGIEAGCVQLNGMFNNKLWKLVGKDQFSGITDKNKTEIYTGDIFGEKLSKEYLKNFVKNHPKKKIYVMEYDVNGFVAKSIHPHPFNMGKFWHHISSDCEIIGNKYENPELLITKKIKAIW